MDLVIENIAKRFAFQTILKDINIQFSHGSKFGISGRNGAGKSTLLKIIAGHMSPSAGYISYSQNGKNISSGELYNHLVFSAPYIDLPPYFSISELLNHYQKFKNITLPDSVEFIDFCELPSVKNKHIGFFSSGMKQKVSLGLAFITECDLMLLDEPTSYLDKEAKSWFHHNLDKVKDTTTIIASNEMSDFDTVSNIFEIVDKKLQSSMPSHLDNNN